MRFRFAVFEILTLNVDNWLHFIKPTVLSKPFALFLFTLRRSFCDFLFFEMVFVEVKTAANCHKLKNYGF